MQEKGFFGRLFDLSFNEFITTKIIKFLYVLAMIGAGIGALVILIGGFRSGSFGGAVGGLILAPIAFVLYVVLARIWLELVIVVFRIAENTAKLAGQSEKPPQA